MECHPASLRHVCLEHLYGHHHLLCLLDLLVRRQLCHSPPMPISQNVMSAQGCTLTWDGITAVHNSTVAFETAHV